MSLLPASIVWRISAWSCWMRALAETGSTIPVQSSSISASFAAMTASQAVTTVVIIVLVVVTDVALATVSPAPLPIHADKSVAIPPMR